MDLFEKKIVVVVSGGIAAYKSADLVSRLRKTGALVRVVMTAAARQFVTPLTFESLSGHRVYEEVFERPDSWEMEHISWAQWADAVLVAPATANLIAKMALGLADDAASTLLLACRAPVWVAPAMNTAMWEHPATVGNVQTLRERGATILEPGSGRLACGDIGAGRMAEPEAIVNALQKWFSSGKGDRPEAGASPTLTSHPVNGKSLSGQTVLITAGPTREYLDPIRFISNRSSGRMGAELAAESVARGAGVIFIHGPLAIDVPEGVEAVPIQSARDLLAAVQRHLGRADIAIFAAAVANYEQGEVASEKLKEGETLALQLQRTPDVAAWAGRHRRPGQTLVGFAAESRDLTAAARRKLAAKQMDLICANPIGEQGVGFESGENRILLVSGEGEPLASPQAPKRQIAAWIFDQIARFAALKVD